MDWEAYYFSCPQYSLHRLYNIMYPIAEVVGIEAILPYNQSEPIVSKVHKYELPVPGSQCKPHDVILDASSFMRSKKANYYQAELIYRNFRTNEYYTCLTEIYDNMYDVEVNLLQNDFHEKVAYSLYFYTYYT